MLKAYYQITKFDADNKIISKSHKLKSRSFLKQMGQHLYALFTANGLANVTDIDNDNGTIGAPYYLLQASHPGKDSFKVYTSSSVQKGSDTMNADDVGIIVGSNNTAVTINDYKLNTRILNGTTTNKIEYLACGVNNLQIGSTTSSFDLVRLFRNSSGGSVTIREVGVYVISGYVSTRFFPNRFCIIRDIVSPEQTVSDGEYLKITYTITI